MRFEHGTTTVLFRRQQSCFRKHWLGVPCKAGLHCAGLSGPQEGTVRDSGIPPLFEALRSQSPQEGWIEFLNAYSPVLYQTARACSSNEEDAADCYLHICEQLGKNNFRRLLKFDPQGTASFTTWLRVVGRNICWDWRRKRWGRKRPFRILQDLSPLELEVYHHRFLRRSSPQETLARLGPRFPAVSLAQLATIEENLQRSLSPRQNWILNSRAFEASSPVTLAGEDEEVGAIDVADPRPNQEEQILQEHQLWKLRKLIRALPGQEALLLQLRFEQDLSLEEIAKMCGLGDAQHVHRRLAGIFKKLRSAMV
jgi:RNA polymerase sigma factor (sigma-70 family)